MTTRKNRKSKKSNKIFRRTRSKRQRGGAPKPTKRKPGERMALIEAILGWRHRKSGNATRCRS